MANPYKDVDREFDEEFNFVDVEQNLKAFIHTQLDKAYKGGIAKGLSQNGNSTFDPPLDYKEGYSVGYREGYREGFEERKKLDN